MNLQIFNTDGIDLKETVNENPRKALRLMAIPGFFSLFCLSLNGLVDTIFVSNCGPESLIGVGMIQSFFVIIVGIGTGLSVAINSYLSYVISKSGSHEEASKVIDNSIFLTAVLGILVSVIMIIILKPLLILVNLYTPAIEPALDYGYILFGGNIFFFFAAVTPAILKAEGEIVKTTYSLTSTSLLNIVLDYILIRVLGYGVTGAAIATVCCSALCCTLLIYFMAKSDNVHLNLPKILKNVDSDLIKKLLKDATPVAFESMVLSLFGILANLMFNALNSPADYSGFVAAYRLFLFVVIPVHAISEGNVTITAYLFGSKQLDKMKDLFKYEIKIACGISLVLWLIIFIFRDTIAFLFTGGADIVYSDALALALPLINSLLIILPLGIISVSVLQGIQHYKESFAVSFIRSILLEVLFGFLGVFLFHDALHVYIGLIVGAILGSILSFMVTGRVLSREIKDMENSV